MDLHLNTFINRLQINDFSKIKSFHIEHSKNYKISDASFEEYLSSSQYRVFGIFHDWDLLGYVIFLVAIEEADIVYICVHKNFRRQGLATKLLNVSRGTFSKIYLEVDTQNIPAIEMYKSFGFSIISTRKNYFQGKDAFLMSKSFI